jgi:Mrp family chromosome partitioning ATPase/capsular polysaccharide biosynthesis protein
VSPLDVADRSLIDYVRILRRRWWIVVLVIAVSAGAAGAYTYRQPTIYRAEMKIVVGQGQGIFLPQFGNVADQFTQTMSNLLQSDIVAARVIRSEHLAIPPNELLTNLTVTTKPESAVLEVTYDDESARLAQSVLAEVGQSFTDLVRERLTNERGPQSNSAISATIFDPAHLLPGTVQPKPPRNLAVAVVLGLVLGMLAALLRERVDETIHGVGEAEEAFGQGAMATLPKRVLGFSPLATVRRRRFAPAAAEVAVQRLRAGVRWSPNSREARTLLITSGSPEEGKTTIASNLAYALAAEGSNVIAVEADLRRPKLNEYLALTVTPQTIGLDVVIEDLSRLSESLVEVPLSRAHPPNIASGGLGPASADGEGSSGRLRAIVAAPGHVWPSEFRSRRTTDLLIELGKQADYVVIDAPPILVVTDAFPFVPAVDAVIATVRNGRTTRTAAKALANTLQRIGARSIELVVTEVDRGVSDTSYRYPLPGNVPGVRTPGRAKRFAILRR